MDTIKSGPEIGIAGDLILVDDDHQALRILERSIRNLISPEITLKTATSREEGRNLLVDDRPTTVVTDLVLEPKEGASSGLSFIRDLRSRSQPPEVLVLTSHHTQDYGIEALKLGAAGFLEKPVHPEHLAALVTNCLTNSVLKTVAITLIRQQVYDDDLGIYGRSPESSSLREQLLFAAMTHLPVLIYGETGTGKGLIAESIHRLSARKTHSFVRYQTNFSSADLLNSELFGHQKGAFTGASESRAGILSLADEGTLFLDEVDEIPVSSQITLLGVLQDKTFRPIGSATAKHSNFRLISATNRPVETSLSEGRLRADFFHRISAIKITVPPLRNRGHDGIEIAQRHLQKLHIDGSVPYLQLDDKASSFIMNHGWPGNVRELLAAVEHAAFRAVYRGANVVECVDFNAVSPMKPDENHLDFHTQVERYKIRVVEEALAECHGNQVQAAKRLGLDRGTIRRILQRA
jgi:DNA-binding NtrC family response regulator